MTIECIPYKRDDFQKEKNETRLVKAAIWCDDKVYTGWRHADIIRYLQSNGIPFPISQHAQGFIDQDGMYYRRIVCASIAHANGQTKDRKNILTSEDLWDMHGNPREPGKPYDPMGDKKFLDKSM